MPSIAKNTLFLYIRLIISTLISLYTSRIILNVLGVNDFGIYQTVGGIVGIMGFLNGALSTASSRYITYALGSNNTNILKETFSTTFYVHLGLAIIIAILAETVGLWFLYNKLSIPEVFHVSIITMAINVTQIPYTSVIISHEKLSVYAYMSIVEVCLKLIAVWALLLFSANRLTIYSILIALVQISIALIYRIICKRKYSESQLLPIFNKKLFFDIIKFSGWSTLGNFALALNSQGMTMLTNMFFGPSVVSSRVIANQVNLTVYSFINNFRTAANPRIIKLYSQNNFSEFERLLIQSTKISYYLLLILSLPIFFSAKQIINIWLGKSLDYVVIFLQLAIIQSFFSIFEISFHTALLAKGRLKENTIITPGILIIQFIIIYLLFKANFSPVSMSIVSIIATACIGTFIKPLLAYKLVKVNIKIIYKVIIRCLLVTIVCFSIPLILSLILTTRDIAYTIIISIICTLWTIFTIYFIGINNSERQIIKQIFKTKIIKLKKI